MVASIKERKKFEYVSLLTLKMKGLRNECKWPLKLEEKKKNFSLRTRVI